MTLTEKLVAKQKELGMSDGKFAAYLGVSRQLWNMTRGGREPGLSVMAGAIRRFPSMTDDVLVILRETNTVGAVA